MDVRTRVAPSPTGFLHVGTTRTALFNWLFARQKRGAFVMRIEDTDKERSKKEYEEDILEGYKWLGLEWDEFYRQSERIEIYKKYLERLLGEGKAFWCPHTKEELETEAGNQRAAKEPPRHRCSARDKGGLARRLVRQSSSDGGSPARPAGELGESGELIRLKNPLGKKICFNDIVRGEICFESDLISDISLAKDLQTPLYNFAAVVDDHEMRISHVIRGEDHISNTPKQILIGRALGAEEPIWAHMALTLGKDRSKLSKRYGATALREYREQGYLPEAMLNYLALLGWNPGNEREIMSKEELIEAFSLERLQKSGAIFDVEKLDWMNGKYIKRKSDEELIKIAKEIGYLSDFSMIDAMGTMRIEHMRLKKLSELDAPDKKYMKQPIEYDVTLLRWKSMSIDEIKKSLTKSIAVIENISDIEFNAVKLEERFLKEIGAGDKGILLWPLRVALFGLKASPGPFEIMEVLGKEETIKRINFALEKLTSKKNGDLFH